MCLCAPRALKLVSDRFKPFALTGRQKLKGYSTHWESGFSRGACALRVHSVLLPSDFFGKEMFGSFLFSASTESLQFSWFLNQKPCLRVRESTKMFGLFRKRLVLRKYSVSRSVIGRFSGEELRSAVVLAFREKSCTGATCSRFTNGPFSGTLGRKIRSRTFFAECMSGVLYCTVLY